jgi:hypothetical protein
MSVVDYVGKKGAQLVMTPIEQNSEESKAMICILRSVPDKAKLLIEERVRGMIEGAAIAEEVMAKAGKESA